MHEVYKGTHKRHCKTWTIYTRGWAVYGWRSKVQTPKVSKQFVSKFATRRKKVSDKFQTSFCSQLVGGLMSDILLLKT